MRARSPQSKRGRVGMGLLILLVLLALAANRPVGVAAGSFAVTAMDLAAGIVLFSLILWSVLRNRP